MPKETFEPLRQPDDAAVGVVVPLSRSSSSVGGSELGLAWPKAVDGADESTTDRTERALAVAELKGWEICSWDIDAELRGSP